MPKEKRRFKRYKSDLSFTLLIGGKAFQAIALDYSVDGVSVLIKGGAPIKAGDVLDLNISKLGVKSPGRVMRISRSDAGIVAGIQRAGMLYGMLSKFAIADILMGLQRSGKTGQLYLKSGGMQKSILFLHGDIFFASSSLRDDWLGSMLLRENRITRQQFEESSERMNATGKRHGTVLVEMGMLKPNELFEAVRRSVELVIYSLFAIKKGEFIFKEEPLSEDETINLRLSAANLIYTGIRRLEDIEAVRSMSPGGDQVICFSTDPLDLFTDLRLSDEDKKLFSMVDGRRTYRQLVQDSGIDAFDAMRAFNALLGTRVIDIHEGAFARRPGEERPGAKEDKRDETLEKHETVVDESRDALRAEEVFQAAEVPTTEELIKGIDQMFREHKTLGYYGVLEVDQGASASQIKKAYYSMARTYHPDKHFSLPVEMKDKLNTIFTYITKAYSTLSTPALRAEYDRSGGKGASGEVETDPLKRAAVKYEEAMVLFRSAKFDLAAHAFGEAAYLDSDNLKYHYYGAMALRESGKHKEAERTLQRALRVEPSNADYLAEAGYIYVALGFFKRAKTSFEKALQSDPRNKRAAEGMSQLPPGT